MSQTPTDTQIQDSLSSLLSNQNQIKGIQGTSVKTLLKIVKDKHSNWIIGKKRLTNIVNAMKATEENNSIETNDYGLKLKKLDTPVSSKNILSNSRRPGAVNKQLASITNSPMLSGSDADDSEWEAPAEVFSRLGSGLKPRQEVSEIARQMDTAKEEQYTMQPRSIVFVPDEMEETVETEDIVAEKTQAVAKLQEFLNRARVHYDDEAAIMEAELYKKQSLAKLQIFFKRSRRTKNVAAAEIVVEESKTAVSLDDVVLEDHDTTLVIEKEEQATEEKSQDNSMSDFQLPVLPLARIETVVPEVEEVVDEDEVVKPSSSPRQRTTSTADTTCNACTLM
jgi:hypothetical protein